MRLNGLNQRKKKKKQNRFTIWKKGHWNPCKQYWKWILHAFHEYDRRWNENYNKKNEINDFLWNKSIIELFDANGQVISNDSKWARYVWIGMGIMNVIMKEQIFYYWKKNFLLTFGSRNTYLLRHYFFVFQRKITRNWRTNCYKSLNSIRSEKRELEWHAHNSPNIRRMHIIGKNNWIRVSLKRIDHCIVWLPCPRIHNVHNSNAKEFLMKK